MAEVDSWAHLHRVEPFRHSWLPYSLLKSTSPRIKALALIWGVFGLFPAAVFAVVGLVEGSFYLEGEALGLLEDRPFLVNLVYIPVLMSGAAIVFPRLPIVLFTLQRVIAQETPSGPNVPETRVRSARRSRRSRRSRSTPTMAAVDDGPYLSAEKFNKLLKQNEETILGQNNSKYLAIALFLGFMVWVGLATKSNWFALESYGFDTWTSSEHMLGFVAVTIYNGLVSALLTWFVTFKFITIMHVMRSICVSLTEKGVIRVRPMSPDGAGGLGPFGAYSLQLVLVLLLPLMQIGARIVTGTVQPAMVFAISLYIPLLIFTFFYPLSGAHRAMRTAKRETLETLSRQFNGVYDDFMIDMKTHKPKTLRADFDLADKVDKLYVKAQQMPVWPFNLATLGRLSGILITAALTVWLKFIIGWVSRVGG